MIIKEFFLLILFIKLELFAVNFKCHLLLLVNSIGLIDISGIPFRQPGQHRSV